MRAFSVFLARDGVAAIPPKAILADFIKSASTVKLIQPQTAEIS